MTQFKDKSDRQEFVSAALFTYPVLMAGDILLYQTDIVPIGDDQRQHLELTRDVAERFNTRFGETFRVPEGVYPEVGARIMDLQEPEQDVDDGRHPAGHGELLDEPDVIRKKFRSAVTDSGSEVRRADDKPGVTNLIDILSALTGEQPSAIEAATTGPATGSSRRMSARRSSRRSSRSRSGIASCAPTRASCSGCSHAARTRRGRRRSRRSRRCTSGWASSAEGAA